MEYPYKKISIHALREEGDPSDTVIRERCCAFLSTPSARRATDQRYHHPEVYPYFYPRPPRGGRRSIKQTAMERKQISIHALREEGDSKTYGDVDTFLLFLSTPSARRATVFRVQAGRARGHFYPRPPRGGRQAPSWHPITSRIFLSTPSARRATKAPQGGKKFAYFYPRPPRGGRRDSVSIDTSGRAISIHALREEGDLPGVVHPRPLAGFLSTPSARRATAFRRDLRQRPDISIHALREEGDVGTQLSGGKDGEVFLSTPSARRATWRLHRGTGLQKNFYPRPPRGGRRFSRFPQRGAV